MRGGVAEGIAIVLALAVGGLLWRHGLGALTLAASAPLLAAFAQSGLYRREVLDSDSRARERRLRDALWRLNPLLLALFPLGLVAWRFGALSSARRPDAALGAGVYAIAVLELVEVVLLHLYAGAEE